MSEASGKDDVPLPAKAGTIVRHTAPSGVVYFLRVPSLMERAAFRREIVQLGGRYPSDDELRTALREGVALASNGEEVLALIDEIAALADAPPIDELPEAERPAELERRTLLLRQDALISQDLRRRWPPLAALLAERVYWNDVAPIVAFRCFCVGWSFDSARLAAAGQPGSPVELPEFLRDAAGMVAEGLADLLPDGDVASAGRRAMVLLAPSDAQRKNSASRSLSPTSREPLTAAPSPATADQAGTSPAATEAAATATG